ncbi:autotransporter domain-containing protein [Pseudopontixanthobacter vadosimaris]|uniref:autotransporter domain-containing protein n=1 Tax=Pseudopontixanthobacter vadosimaris TaxID=2726450 RepID=UPI0014735A5C
MTPTKLKLVLSAATAAMALMAPAAVQAQQTPSAASEAQAPRVIVFGDSLSDGGFFNTVLPLPPGEGSFTTNPDPVAPEVFSGLLGFDLNPVYGQGGTNYAIGGARVTQRNGLAIPIVQQFENFLAAGGSFAPGDIVYVQGGGNDYFSFLAGGAADPTILTTAATELAALVQRIEAAGADRIVTLAIQSNSPGLDLFNTTYKQALAANNSNVLFFDTAQLFNEIVANAGAFGITNVTGTACTGSSLTCGPEDYVTPNANRTYLMADAVHPAGITQEIQGQAIASLFTGFTLPGSIARSGQRAIRDQRAMFETVQRNGLGTGGGAGLFGNIGYSYSAEDGASNFDQRAVIGTLGLDYSLSDAVGIGIVGGYSDGDGDYTSNNGALDQESWTVSAYGRAGIGPFGIIADATYGQGDVAMSRSILLGPVTRVQDADTDTELFGARASLHYTVPVGMMSVGPEIGVAYERVEVDGFTESGGFSTSLTLADAELESLTGRAGLVATAPLAGGVGFLARASYVHEFKDEANRFTVTASGAPVSYNSSYAFGDDDYGEIALGVDGAMGAVILRAGASAEIFRNDGQAVTAYAGLGLRF